MTGLPFQYFFFDGRRQIACLIQQSFFSTAVSTLPPNIYVLTFGTDVEDGFKDTASTIANDDGKVGFDDFSANWNGNSIFGWQMPGLLLVEHLIMLMPVPSSDPSAVVAEGL